MVKQMKGIFMADGAFTIQTDPSPNNPDAFGACNLSGQRDYFELHGQSVQMQKVLLKGCIEKD